MNTSSESYRLVLIGPHGAGKTTLGQIVAARLGIAFVGEIGKALRMRELEKDRNHHALVPLPFFDEKIMRLEMRRDICVEGSRVIETWHPGNLAYCRERTPTVYRLYRSLIATHIASLPGKTFIQPLCVARHVARLRQTECGGTGEELHDFFWRVAEQAEIITHELGLHTLPPVNTDQASPKACSETIIFNLQQSICSSTLPTTAYALPLQQEWQTTEQPRPGASNGETRSLSPS